MTTSVQIGDKEKRQIKSALVAMPLDSVKASLLAIESDSVNDRNKSGKRFGAMLVTEAAQLVVAVDGGTNAVWRNQFTKANVLPVGGTVKTTTVIGDGRRVHKDVPICAIAVPQVAKANLVKGTHVINDSNRSGKKLGSMVADEAGNLYVALGSNWNSVWFGAVPITPKGAPTSMVGKLGQTGKSVQPVVASVDLPVVLEADLANIGHPINDAEISGKRLGSMVVTKTGEILVATGSAKDSAWTGQFAGADTTPV